MSETFVASVQYGDFKGTVSIDGHDHGTLEELARHAAMAGGYVPIGFQFTRFYPDDDGTLPFSIIAAEAEEYGNSIAEISKYGKSDKTLYVRAFHGSIPVSELDGIFKRVDVKVLTKHLSAENVQVQS